MASRGHEIIVRTEEYLKSIGKNNSVGKYDRVVRGVKSLLEQGFLEGPELERAIKQEADKLLRKYNLDAAPKKIYDPVLCMMVDEDSVSTRDRYFDVTYSVGGGIWSGVMVQANSEQEAIEKAKAHNPRIARAEKVVAGPATMSVESAKMRGKSVIDDSSVSAKDTITGHFTNVQGQSFKKEFANQKELADFIESARKVGTKFIASHGNEYKKFFDSSARDREIVEERENGVELIRTTEGYWIVKVDGQYIADGNESRMRKIYKEEVRNNDSSFALDEAIRTIDRSIDYSKLADYLWTWEDIHSSGNPVMSIFDDKLGSFPGPHDPEHKTEAYRWASNEALKELDSVYSKLKSEVDKKLRNGYNAAKAALKDAGKG